jgi:hypothetical protein
MHFIFYFDTYLQKGTKKSDSDSLVINNQLSCQLQKLQPFHQLMVGQFELLSWTDGTHKRQINYKCISKDGRHVRVKDLEFYKPNLALLTKVKGSRFLQFCTQLKHCFSPINWKGTNGVNKFSYR